MRETVPVVVDMIGLAAILVVGTVRLVAEIRRAFGAEGDEDDVTDDDEEVDDRRAW